MKLLVVSHACVTPVNQRFFADVARQMSWEITLVVPATWSNSYETGFAAVRSPEFHGDFRTISVWKPGNIPLHLYKSSMVGLLGSVRPDAIYVHHEPYGAATFQLYLANRLSVRVPIGFYAAQNIVKNYPLPFRWIEQFVFRQSGFAFPCSAGALQVLRGKGYTGPAEELALPVDLAIYRPQPEWAAAKRRELGIGAEEFVIGYLGRLVEEKGLKTMFHALAQLPTRNWRAVLVGSGPLETDLRALAGELGIADRIVFIGFVPHEEAPGWYSVFDLFVLPSETRANWKEQFGRVIIEANACEVPVVGTESGAIGDVLRSTGGGLIVPEADPGKLAGAIHSLMVDPGLRHQLAQTGAHSARTRYSQSYLANLFANVIERAVSGNRQS